MNLLYIKNNKWNIIINNESKRIEYKKYKNFKMNLYK